ncbi:gas vesicle protein GvpG [Candidatus Thiosymbion oneisti]|uniref:gas vesicle protein GvpG n=1 Tax=Candidatus Thiosymbion oneisti TaxID=589554 RepID=UPI000AFF47EA|nr:gas vesicle protein GvpG [Candidatus Thiosymbion oneisti]
MLIIDDLLLAPFKGLYWIGKEIHKAVLTEQVSQREAITTALSELYMELETGRIDEAEFDAREAELLDALDRLQEPSQDGA